MAAFAKRRTFWAGGCDHNRAAYGMVVTGLLLTLCAQSSNYGKYQCTKLCNFWNWEHRIQCQVDSGRIGNGRDELQRIRKISYPNVTMLSVLLTESGEQCARPFGRSGPRAVLGTCLSPVAFYAESCRSSVSPGCRKVRKIRGTYQKSAPRR